MGNRVTSPPCGSGRGGCRDRGGGRGSDDRSRSAPINPRSAPIDPRSPRRDVLHLRPQRGHGGVGFLPQPPGDGGGGPGAGDPVPAADPAVKIQGQNKEMLAAACQMFLGKSESEIGQIALETLEGHQRAIMAHMTVEEIYKDRQKFSDQVFRVASSDLVNMGISVVSYTLKDVHDEQDYLRSLGKGRTAQVQRDARVGEAEAKRDAGIREARARQEQVSAQLLSEEATARAQRDFQVAQAECDGAVSARRATAELAFQLQAARSQQAIAAQRGEVALVERAQRAQLQEQEVGRRLQELEATVRKPAEAERYRLERLAEAQRTQVLLQAEAEAEALKVSPGGPKGGLGIPDRIWASQVNFGESQAGLGGIPRGFCGPKSEVFWSSLGHFWLSWNFGGSRSHVWGPQPHFQCLQSHFWGGQSISRVPSPISGGPDPTFGGGPRWDFGGPRCDIFGFPGGFWVPPHSWDCGIPNPISDVPSSILGGLDSVFWGPNPIFGGPVFGVLPKFLGS
uniref:Flotillin n=1 Tax=Cyanoderma ruficeps TaxID=181631 RepID=A0A8C3QNP9_9PASS